MIGSTLSYVFGFVVFLFGAIIIGFLLYYRKEASKYKHIVILRFENGLVGVFKAKRNRLKKNESIEEYILLEKVTPISIFNKKEQISIQKPDDDYIFKMKNGNDFLYGDYTNGAFLPRKPSEIKGELKTELKYIDSARNYLNVKSKQEQSKLLGDISKVLVFGTTFLVVVMVVIALIFTLQYATTTQEKTIKKQDEMMKMWTEQFNKYIKVLQQNTNILMAVAQQKYGVKVPETQQQESPPELGQQTNTTQEVS